MATRFYLPASGTPPLGSLAVNANWELTNGLIRLPCFTMKQNTALATSQRTWPATTTQQWCWWQFQSDILKYAYNWLATDTVSMVIGKCAETTSGGDSHLAYVVRVVSGDGATIRGVIGLYHATSTEFPLMASAATRIHDARTNGATAFASQPGDRIIIEIGLHGVTPLAQLIQMRIGDPTPPPDDFALTAGLTTDLCPWVQLSRTVEFGTPPEEHSGSAVISGNGSLVAAAQKGGKGSALTSGKGALAALAIAGMMGIASISGGPGHQVATGLKDTQNIASISAGGALTAVGQKAAMSGPVISGGGSLSATGEALETHSGAAIISGNGALLAAGQKDARGSPIVSGNGILISEGKKAAPGIAAISARGALSASSAKGSSSTASILGGGLIEGEGKKLASAAGLISGGGVLAGMGSKQTFGDSIISGGGSLNASGVKAEGETRFGVASISGGGAIIGIGEKSAFSAALISGAGSLPAVGFKNTGGSCTLIGGGSIFAAGGIIAVPEKSSVPAEFWASAKRRKPPTKPSENLMGVKKFP